MTVNHNEALSLIREALEKLYGPRLKGVVLYGSTARGEDRADSDIDVLVLLDGPFEYGRELEKIVDTLFSLSLTFDRPISAKPAHAEDYEQATFPLYETAKRDGIRV